MPPAGLLYGLVAALGWGLVDVVASVVGRRIAPLALALGAQGLGLVIFVVVFVVTGAQLGTTGVAAALLFGSVAAVGYITSFYALRIGPLAVVSPVIAAYGGLSVVLAVLFRGEALAAADWLGVAIALVGIVLVGLVLDEGRRSRLVGMGVAFALVANVGYALATVGLAGPTRELGWLPAMVVSRAANIATVLLAIGVVVAIDRRRRGAGATTVDPTVGRRVPRRRAPLVVGVVAVGLCDTVATISFSMGLERSETWLIGLTSSFGPALAVLFAVAVLRERLRPQQWLGLALLVVSVVVLGLPV